MFTEFPQQCLLYWPMFLTGDWAVQCCHPRLVNITVWGVPGITHHSGTMRGLRHHTSQWYNEGVKASHITVVQIYPEEKKSSEDILLLLVHACTASSNPSVHSLCRALSPLPPLVSSPFSFDSLIVKCFSFCHHVSCSHVQHRTGGLS